MSNINLKESICWYCRHSGSDYDDYVCPWDKEGKAVKGWMRYQRGFIIRCPHFVEYGTWRPDEIYTGKWSKKKGIAYCRQGDNRCAGRVACLELGVMFPSLMDVARYLSESGRISQKNIANARASLYNAWMRNERGGKFTAYGLTFARIEHDDRCGNWNKAIFDEIAEMEKK